MKNFTACVENFLDQKELHYRTLEFDWGTDTIIGFELESGCKQHVHFICRDDQAPVLAVWDLIHIPDQKLATALIHCNKDNQRRFFRFAIDEDRDLQLRYDFPNGISEESFSNSISSEMFPMFLSAVKNYYEDYAQLVYSDNHEELSLA